MKSIIASLFACAILLGPVNAQQRNIQPLLGFGFRGITGGEDIPFGYSFTVGIKTDRAGFLSTLSYAERETQPVIRVAGLSTQLLLSITDQILLSVGPEVNITLLGLMKLGIIAGCQFFLFDNAMLSVGFSDVGKLNAGIIFTL